MDYDVTIRHALYMQTSPLKGNNIFACIYFYGAVAVLDNTLTAFKDNFTVSAYFHVNTAEICPKYGYIVDFSHIYKSPSNKKYAVSGDIMRKIMVCIISALFLGMLVSFPKACAEGISAGLESSAKILVPSLFPFMVLSSFIIRSGAYEYFGKSFSPLAKIFKVPKSAVSGVVLSFIGGFPVGARCVKLLYESGEISEKQAERMMKFCVCSGASFLVTAIGAIMLNNIKAGIILYVSQIASGIILGIVSGIFSDNEDKRELLGRKSENTDIMQSFILSCSDGAGAIVELTALVAIFSMFINVLSSWGADSYFLTSIIEVTAASRQIAEKGCPLWVMSFAVGYGGLCVHLQIFSLLKGIKINKPVFELYRLANAVLSSIITYFICRFFDTSVQTFAIQGNANAELTSTSIVGAVSLVIMSGIFLLSLNGKNRICFFEK